eukprot:CAMPEP_0176438306 /NCGR_PEP_ID=MMETSP0127-20121128/19199_1 /TAXON_ID=938130 /ORGANISM="Platyophrya macrostoma, Strain WH" /LENGTH=301 /DNA_ID=CAMNT_0017822219 /DNA_START=57 /DNA_END=963 /DNA_ORIENTATION=-
MPAYSTQAKYTKVSKPKEQTEKNEIRITGDGSARRYIGYAANLLLGEEGRADTIILKASGNAAKTACLVAEILRTHILGLHQLNVIKTIEVEDVYEPTEEGLDKVVIKRSLAVLEIQLSTKDKAFDTKAPGYQEPLAKNNVEEKSLADFLKREKRRRDDDEERPSGEKRRGDREEKVAEEEDVVEEEAAEEVDAMETEAMTLDLDLKVAEEKVVKEKVAQEKVAQEEVAEAPSEVEEVETEAAKAEEKVVTETTITEEERVAQEKVVKEEKVAKEAKVREEPEVDKVAKELVDQETTKRSL